MQREDADLDIDIEGTDRPIWKILTTYGPGRFKFLIIGGVGALFGILAGLVAPTVLGNAVDTIFVGEEPFSLPLIPEEMYPEETVDQFWLVAAIIISAYLLESIFNVARSYGLQLFAQHIKHDLRVDTYSSIQQLTVDFFEDNSTGELMSILNSDVNNLEEFFNGGIIVLTRILFTLLGVSLVLFVINWQLALVSLVVAPMIALFTYWFVRTIQPIYLDVRDQVGKVNSLLENNLGAIKEIKASTMEEFEEEEVEKASQKYFNINWRAIKTQITFYPGIRLLSGFAFVLTFIIGGYWVLAEQPPLFFTKELTVGQFVIFILLSQELVWPMANFGELINMYQKAVSSGKRILALKQKSKEEQEEGAQLTGDQGHVEYKDVSFSYEESDQILSNVNIEAEPGQSIALVGPTGAGKSTIVKLLLRFYEPNEGKIEINRQDISNISKESLRSEIGYVSQENVMFPESIAKNIAYSDPDATREEIVHAAKSAKAHEFIKDLESGYDTQVGEDGVKLSGGQKQRIGIARAVLQDPQILILDEATSDVDTETEVKIQKGLEHLTEDRTVIAIAHRLSTVKDSDKIIVLEDGKVVETGKHKKLLEDDGIYAKLWKVQAGEIEQATDYFLEE